MSSFSKRISALCLGVLTACLLSCGGEAKGLIETGTDFSMAVATTQYKVAPGTLTFTPIDVTWVGCCPPRDVTFALQGLPSGVSSVFSSNPNPTSTNLQLNVSSATPTGSYDLLLKASSASLVHTKSLRLVVDANAPSFSATITPLTFAMDAGHPGIASIEIARTGGFSEPIAVKVFLPLGFTSTLSSQSVVQPGASLASAAEIRTLTIQSGTAAAGTYPISVELLAAGQFIRKELTAIVHALPLISGFTATPDQIHRGYSSTLVATFTGGTGSIAPSVGGVVPGQSVTVAPALTTLYVLSVTNPAGTTVSRSATLTLLPDVVVQVQPSSRFVTVGKTVPLAATITGATNPALSWSLVESGGGSLVASGASANYTAPAVPGIYHVRATSVEDPLQFGEFTATVVPAPNIKTFTASPALINRGASSTLTAVFSDGTGVVDTGVGAVTPGLAFSVSPLVTTTYTLTVTNLAGDGVTSSVTVEVNGVAVSITPPSAALGIWATQLFTATVTGAVDTSVTWSVVEPGGGSITSGGLYSAPAIAGIYHVVATSNSDPTKSVTATVVVSSVVVTPVITLFPSTQRATDGSQVFMRHTLVGLPDYRVTWSISPATAGAATINPTTGVISVPLSPLVAVYTVTATSMADPLLSESTTLTVQSTEFYSGFGATGAMVTPRWEHSMTALADGLVLISGGTTTQGGLPDVSQAEVFDPNSGSFSGTGSLAKPRRQHTSTLLHTGKVLIAGGFDAAGSQISHCELYDPETGTFTATNSLVTPRAGHRAELLPNGMLLVAGGYTTGGVPVKSTELFDPNQEVWLPGVPMQTARVRHALVRLLDGSVLVAGGTTNGADTGLTNSAEVFTPSLTDPSTGTWTPAGSMADSLADASAVLTPDGKVIFAGGTRNAGTFSQVTNRTETFDPTVPAFTLNTFNLTTARRDAIGLLDALGEVFFIGGSSGTAILSSWELYQPGSGFIDSGVMRARQSGQNGRGLMLNTGSLLLTGYDTTIAAAARHAEIAVLLAP